MKQNNTSSYFAAGVIIVVFVGMAGFLWLVFSTLTSHNAIEIAKPSPPKEIQMETSQPQPPPKASSTGESFSGWKAWSNGIDWKYAPEEDKRDLCRRLADASRKGNSANFFYDALEAFYNSKDSGVLTTSIRDTTTLIEAGSSALPETSRNY